MIAKLIVKGRHRDEARRRLIMALEDLVALGPATNQTFLAHCLGHPVFAAGDATTAFIDEAIDELTALPASQRHHAAVIATVLLQAAGERSAGVTATMSGLQPRHPTRWEFTLDGVAVAATLHAVAPQTSEVRLDGVSQQVTLRRMETGLARVDLDGHCLDVPHVIAEGELLFRLCGQAHRVRDRSHAASMRQQTALDGRIRASMAGRVVAVHASAGEPVTRGQAIVTIEAMKIEHTHVAPTDGKLAAVLVETHQQVTLRQVLAELAQQVPL